MESEMGLEIAGGREVHVTLVALVGPLPAVHALVHNQLTAARKTPPAHLTGIRLLSWARRK
jgi:hypothetical protein